jgi:hypothetical protein
MSDAENFLARWSRRKREIEQHEGVAPSDEAPIEFLSDPALSNSEAAEIDASGREGETQEPAQPFDPASLPPIESITAQTDIRGYFAPGVPSDLARAALRRVWSADPTIRDFIGLSENAWDFNAPETIPGFGPITASDDVAGMMRQMLGEAREAVQQIVPGPEKEASEPPQLQDDTAEQRPIPQPPIGMRTEPVSSPNPGEEAALPAIVDGSQNEPGSAQAIQTANNEPGVRRGHGSALPK